MLVWFFRYLVVTLLAETTKTDEPKHLVSAAIAAVGFVAVATAAVGFAAVAAAATAAGFAADCSEIPHPADLLAVVEEQRN